MKKIISNLLLLFFIPLILLSCSKTPIEPVNYSPDIYYLSDKSGKPEIYTMEVSKRAIELLELSDLPTDMKVESLAWSQTSYTWFFSLSDQEGNDIYSLDRNGKNLQRITQTPSIIKSPIVPSPNGKFIAFIGYSNNLDLYVIGSNGEAVGYLDLLQSNESHPTWTSDSKHIIFRSDHGGLPNIYSVEINGKNLTNLSKGPGVDGLFDISIISNRLVFDSDRDGNRDLFIVDLGSENYINLTNDPSRDLSPKWSPNEKYILFQSDRDGGEDLYMLELEVKQITRLTHSPEVGELNPIWCLDSQCIIFNSNNGYGNQDLFMVTLDGKLNKLTTSDSNDYSPNRFHYFDN